MITLLWEIARLRSLLLRTNQLSSEFRRPNNCLGPVFDEFMEKLKQEPCVQERDLRVHELLNPPGKPRKGMAPR